MGLRLTGERQVGKKLEHIAADHRERYEWAARYLKRKFNRSCVVLDAACGGGYGAHIMAEEGHNVFGVDNAAEAIEHAEKYFKHDGVEYIHADIFTDFIASEKFFDAVVAFEIVEHIAEDEKFIQRLASLSNLLIASVPNELINPFDAEKYPFHKKHYTPFEFEDLLLGNGYSRIIDWQTQVDKWTGDIEAGDHGRTLLLVAEK